MENDLLTGGKAIGEYLGVTQARAFYMCEKKEIPAVKIAGRWMLRKSTWLKFIERLEAASTDK